MSPELELQIGLLFAAAEADLTAAARRRITDRPTEAESGVYALFHFDELVYVGKTVNLRNRLNKHRRTIEDASQIDTADMTYACITFDQHFMVAVESYLIETKKPPWNSTGFGSNAHGKGRPNQKLSEWNQIYGRQLTR